MTQAAIDLALHAKQSLVAQSDATEILFGGAAGPGKSHLIRVLSILWCAEIPGLQFYLFRRELPDLVKNHVEGPAGYRSLLAPWTANGLVRIVEGEVRFLFNGSRVWLCHCKDPKDVYGYQGAEMHVFAPDELTQWQEDMYRFLRSRVRAPGLRVPEKYAGQFPRIIAGSNPGGIGHNWVKATFIDGAEPYTVRQMPADEGGMRRQFIPARLEDNPTMARDDPEYESRLTGLGSKELVRAMREGDWDIVAGAYFDNMRRDRHALPAWTPPKHWTRFRAMDWGSYRPFCVLWAVVAEPERVDMPGGSARTFPAGALIVYREWYGCVEGKPNTGIKLTIEELAEGILEREAGEKVDEQMSRADPSMWKEDGGPSLIEKMVAYRSQKHGRGVVFQPADNSRVPGWQELRARLDGDPDRGPMLYLTESCLHTWRTVPVLQHDDHKVEDVDTEGEDHAGDALRYLCMARPMSRVPKKRPSNAPHPWSLDGIIKRDEDAKRGRRAA